MIVKIISGGQSGVDRAALDAAIELGMAYGGWCPAGGWAEDFPYGGLHERYLALKPTPKPDPAQRTDWNVRDSDATLICLPAGYRIAGGTQLTKTLAQDYGRPVLHVHLPSSRAAAETRAWLAAVNPGALNIAGPRESEAPGAYALVKAFLLDLLSAPAS
jgi:Circularly permutated YpsA SLOG family